MARGATGQKWGPDEVKNEYMPVSEYVCSKSDKGPQEMCPEIDHRRPAQALAPPHIK